MGGGLGEGVGGGVGDGVGEGEGGKHTVSILRPKFPNSSASKFNPSTSILYSSPWTEEKVVVLSWELNEQGASSLKAKGPGSKSQLR